MTGYEKYSEFAHELRQTRDANDGKYSPEEGELLVKMTDLWMDFTDEEILKTKELFRGGLEFLRDEFPPA